MRYIFSGTDGSACITDGPLGQSIAIPQVQQWVYLTVEINPDELPLLKEKPKRCEYCGAPK